MKKLSHPHFAQDKEYTCGPASLQMVFHYFGKNLTQDEIEIVSETSPTEGTLTHKMAEAASHVGLHAYEKENGTIDELITFIDREIPVILNFMDVPQDSGHFATLVGYADTDLIFHDPWNGPDYLLPRDSFQDIWRSKWEPRKGWLLAISDKPIS